MKTNEAPDKIYLQVCGDCPQTDCVTCKFEDLEGVTWNKDRIFPKDVGYTRTDAFIEKAVRWIEEINNHHHIMRYSDSCEPPLSELTEWFKNYMKGEEVWKMKKQ